MIKFKEVTKVFGSITALDEVSFNIDQGEFVFLTGPSGAGKTTIFKLLLREYLPTRGEINVFEKDLAQLRGQKICHYRRKIGVVFQDFKLLWEKTVFENIAIPLEIGKLSPKEIKGRVEEILEKVSLLERKDLFPAQLAGGELQRVSLARAIVNRPEILFADEPTGNLDPKTSLVLVELLKDINQEGTTVVMATHNVGIVDLFNERVIELAGGKVVRDEEKGKYESLVSEESQESDSEKKELKKKKGKGK